MARKSANTPKPAKPSGNAARKAAVKSTKDGQRITRAATRSRQEVRQVTTHQQGHPK